MEPRSSNSNTHQKIISFRHHHPSWTRKTTTTTSAAIIRSSSLIRVSSPSSSSSSSSSVGVVFSHLSSTKNNDNDIDSISSMINNNNIVIRPGTLLSDIPTPCLLLELSLIEKFLNNNKNNNDDNNDNSSSCNKIVAIDEFLLNPIEYLKHNNINIDDFNTNCCAIYVHTSVTSTKIRDDIVKKYGSGKSVTICNIDVTPEMITTTTTTTTSPESESSTSSSSSGSSDTDNNNNENENNNYEEEVAYLGLGLANHHVGGYYWARSMGIGSSLPAHGVCFRRTCSNDDSSGVDSSDGDDGNGELYWKQRQPDYNPYKTTEESSNSNDGKRSEWVDFLSFGDTVQLVPYDSLSILTQKSTTTSSCSSSLSTNNNNNTFNNLLVGIRRAGRPLGSDPIVERIWIRNTKTEEEEEEEVVKWISPIEHD